MKAHVLSHAVQFNRRFVSRSAPILALLLVASPLIPMQAVAQNRIILRIVEQEGAAAGSGQAASAALTPSPIEISAPTPAPDEAKPDSSPTISFLALEAAENSGWSSSQDAAKAPASAANPAITPPAKSNPPHHKLGVTLAVLGTATLVVGVAGFTLTRALGGFCSPARPCGAFHDATIGMMPAGAGVAITGFYLASRR
jgi:hypothetical protein